MEDLLDFIVEKGVYCRGSQESSTNSTLERVPVEGMKLYKIRFSSYIFSPSMVKEVILLETGYVLLFEKGLATWKNKRNY